MFGVTGVLFVGRHMLRVFDRLPGSIRKRRVEDILSFKSQNGFDAVDPRLGSRTANQARGCGEMLFHVLGLRSNKPHRTFSLREKQSTEESPCFTLCPIVQAVPAEATFSSSGPAHTEDAVAPRGLIWIPSDRDSIVWVTSPSTRQETSDWPEWGM